MSGKWWIEDEISVHPSNLGRPIDVATFGDSTADFCPNTNVKSYAIPLPATAITEQKFAGLNSVPILVCSYGNIRAVGCGGISGQNTSQFLARSAITYSPQRASISDVIATNPDVLCFHGASVNDFAGVRTSDNLEAIASATFARHMTCVERFTSRGIHVIDCGMYGIDGAIAGGDLSAQQAICVIFNAKIMASSNLSIYYHPWSQVGVVGDGTGAFLPGVSDDGLHLNALGALRVGSVQGQILDTIFSGNPKFSHLAFDGQNAWANPSSNKPAGFTVSSSYISATFSACTPDGCVADCVVSDAILNRISLENTSLLSSISGKLAGTVLCIEFGASITGSQPEGVRGSLSVIWSNAATGTKTTVHGYNAQCFGTNYRRVYRTVLPVDAVGLNSLVVKHEISKMALGAATVKFLPISVWIE